MDTVTVSLGENEVLLDRLLANGIALAHDCGGALACSSCSIVVVDGAENIPAATEDEIDMLDRAGVDAPGARLACQVSGPGELRVGIARHEPPAHGKALPLIVTEAAARHLARQLGKHAGAVAVRLGVEPAGCSGLRYRIDPAPSVMDGDVSFEAGGVRLVVDRATLPYVHGTRVDLVQDGLARRLRFDNPNARQSCGCGESFSP
jgi:iron-sulfur cluster assembly accessory protein